MSVGRKTGEQGLDRTAGGRRSDFAWSSLGYLVYGICQWAVLAILARFAGVTRFGEYSLALAIVTPITLLAGLQLRMVQGTDARNTYTFPDYLAVRAIASAAAMTVVLVCAGTLGVAWGIAPLIVLTGVAKCVETVSDLYQGLLLQHERHDLFGKSIAIRGVLSTAGFASGLLLRGSLTAAAAGILLGFLLCLACFDIPVARHAAGLSSPLAVRFDRWRTLLRLTAPLGLVTGLAALNYALPRYFIEYWNGTAALGFFSAAGAFQAIGVLLITAFAQSGAPAMSRAAQSNDFPTFTRLLTRLVAACTVVGLAGIAVAAVTGSRVLRLGFGPDYAGQAPLLLAMMAACLFAYISTALWYGLIATRLFDVQIAIHGIGIAVTAAICWKAVPAIGPVGGALALGGSAIASSCFTAWVLYWHLHGRQIATLKRLFDLVVGSTALLVFSPIIAVAALAIRLRLGSPVLFPQERTGKDGVSFFLFKFRTMTVARDAAGESLSDEQRLTGLGRFLRRYSIDELPQLLNVLRGEMSLVGPRPLLPRYLARYSAEQARRHQVQPGITGLTQVSGRNLLDWDSKFKLDVWYVDHASFWLDLRILLRTAGAVISARGVSAEGTATAQEFLGNPCE